MAVAYSGSPCRRRFCAKRRRVTAYGFPHTRAAIVTGNPMLHESLTAQIESAGGEVVPLASVGANENAPPVAIDAVLIDAGTSSEVELGGSAWGYKPLDRDADAGCAQQPGGVEEHGLLLISREPIRQASLVNRILAEPDAQAIDHAPHGEFPAARCGRCLQRGPHASHSCCGGQPDQRIADARVAAAPRTSRHRGDVGRRRRRSPESRTVRHSAYGSSYARSGRYRNRATHPGNRIHLVPAVNAHCRDHGGRHGPRRQACQDAGMDGFITKPIAPAELDAMIARLFPDGAREAAE